MTSFVFIILLYIVRIISAMQLLHLRFSITTQIAISIETFFEFSGFFLGASWFAVRKIAVFNRSIRIDMWVCGQPINVAANYDFIVTRHYC